jgi:hypothetical protein
VAGRMLLGSDQQAAPASAVTGWHSDIDLVTKNSLSKESSSSEVGEHRCAPGSLAQDLSLASEALQRWPQRSRCRRVLGMLNDEHERERWAKDSKLRKCIALHVGRGNQLEAWCC